jgi:hypothetical protein
MYEADGVMKRLYNHFTGDGVARSPCLQCILLQRRSGKARYYYTVFDVKIAHHGNTIAMAGTN